MKREGARYRVGIDVGGTFTDGVMMDERTGEISLAKVDSTPRDPSVGYARSIERLLEGSRVRPRAIAFNVHGTTVATNTIIEGKQARTALLTTEGFRDVLEVARQIRPRLYDIFFDKPAPLVRRHLCFGVHERVDSAGRVLVPLDEAQARDAARQVRAAGVEAAAICFLHSYLFPEHERRMAAILAEECPGLYLAVSSDVCPEFREYVRSSTTSINASLMPIVTRYVDRVEDRLRERGLRTGLHLMTSAGGIIGADVARRVPVQLIESGPAAGVMAAVFLGKAVGAPNVIALDIGGTTAKTALVERGVPRVSTDFEVGAAATSPSLRNRGGGYAVRMPVVDLVEIGAGGGSIGWVDAGGALRVGPRSAGADPGPACYGRGGVEPTLTDANLLLGRINPAYFLGGETLLQPGLSEEAVRRRCAEPLGLDLLRAAHGMIEIANANMIAALRLISVQRGFDPRDFLLVAFGGAGPLHANALATELGIRRILVPLGPGVTSALGLLVTDLKHDFVRTYIRRTAQADLAFVAKAFAEFEAEARGLLEREGVARAKMTLRRSVDMRYVGQSYELNVSLPAGPLGPRRLRALDEAFYREHERVYGFAARGEPTSLVNLRLTAVGAIRKPRLCAVPAGTPRPEPAARKAERPAYFAETNGLTACPIYDRYALRARNVLRGPAIVEELDSTTVIHPGWRATVDRYGNLLLERK